MSWSDELRVLCQSNPKGWFGDLVMPEVVEPPVGWWAPPSLATADAGIGRDDSLIVPRFAAIDGGTGSDLALVSRIPQLPGDSGIGIDRGLIRPKAFVVEAGLGADAARSGVRPSDEGRGADAGLVRPRFAVVDAAVGAELLTSLRARIAVSDRGLGTDTAAAGFTPHAAALTSYTSPGTYQYRIPVWCRYIEIILCGSGRGGNGNSNALPGAGGNAGGWAAITLERGVDIPWTLLDITIVVKDGGAGGTGSIFVGGLGGDGSASTAAVSGTVILSAPGGTGERSGNQAGGSPGPYNYGGQTYPGGAETTTGSGTPGNPPGGGGRGGNGNTFGGFNGGKGAPGVGHVRARQ